MREIDLTGLDGEQLTDLIGSIHAELASRERKHRADLRAELESRLAAEGYKLEDLFPRLGGENRGRGPRRKRPARFRNPQAPDVTWSGVGRMPKWVQAILDERGIDFAEFKSIPMYRVHP